MTCCRRITEAVVIIGFLWYVLSIIIVYVWVPYWLCTVRDGQNICYKKVYSVGQNNTGVPVELRKEMTPARKLAIDLVIISHFSSYLSTYAVVVGVNADYGGFNISKIVFTMSIIGSIIAIFNWLVFWIDPIHGASICLMIALPFQLPVWVYYLIIYACGFTIPNSIASSLNLFGIRNRTQTETEHSDQQDQRAIDVGEIVLQSQPSEPEIASDGRSGGVASAEGAASELHPIDHQQQTSIYTVQNSTPLPYGTTEEYSVLGEPIRPDRVDPTQPESTQVIFFNFFPVAEVRTDRAGQGEAVEGIVVQPTNVSSGVTLELGLALRFMPMRPSVTGAERPPP